MPWTTKADTARHNKRAADSPKLASKWRTVANAVLARTGMMRKRSGSRHTQ